MTSTRAALEAAVADHILAIAPYQPGKPVSEIARTFGLEEGSIVKLASNENPLGMSDSVRSAVARAVQELGRYPDPNGFDLKQDLSRRYQVPADWITLGNGSNDLLELISLVLLGPDVSCVYAEHAFTVYKLCTQERGARHIMVPAVDYGHDLNAMLEAIRPDTRLLFIANPNNPTGTFLPGEQIEAFLAQVWERHGRQVTVVLDEAYNEYLDPDLRFDSADMVRRYPNLIVTRTFSKAYGLAGLRIGYALAQAELTDILNRVRQPFNVNSVALEAARAALADQDFLQRSYGLNLAGKQFLGQFFESLGLEYVPSHGNFILVRVGDAAGINLALLKQGVIVRPVAGDGLPEHLRITIGLPEENQRFAQALTGILRA